MSHTTYVFSCVTFNFVFMSETLFEKRKKAIGKRIKELRINAGYSSYAKFAIAHNLENKSVWRWENGENYKLETLSELAEIHGLTLEEFFKGVE